MVNLSGKKLLVLGGAFQHCKLVEAAKELGVITYVTDYLAPEDAPAKLIADKYYMYNITDFDEIEELCKTEKIDGVISTSLDACQRPYQQLCERLSLPCFGTAEQFRVLTDKNAFKECCALNGVDVIPEYKVEDFADKKTCEGRVEFPILIKPCDSRGSRGQSICNSFEDAKTAIPFAQSESSNGEVVIEKYMGQANDFSMTYLVLNGNPYLIRTVDRFLGKYEDGLDKLCVGSASPSVFTDVYMKDAHIKVKKFIKAIGLKTAPIFMQGFVDGDLVRFYDPGLRMGGGEFERMYTHVFKRNPLSPLIEFALTGKVDEDGTKFSDDDTYLDGKVISQVLLPLRPGKIGSISGMDEVKKHKNVVSAFQRFAVGDVVTKTGNVRQRFCEIAVVCDSNKEMADVVGWIFDTLKVLDENGEDMIVSRYSMDRYLDRIALFGK